MNAQQAREQSALRVLQGTEVWKSIEEMVSEGKTSTRLAWNVPLTHEEAMSLTMLGYRIRFNYIDIKTFQVVIMITDDKDAKEVWMYQNEMDRFNQEKHRPNIIRR